MSKIHLLRMFLNDRLAAVVEEICGQVERTIAEYQDEVCRSKEEICQLRRVMNKVPEIKLHRSDIQQLNIPEEQVSAEQPHWSGPDPDQHLRELPMIKEEHDELWISHEDDQLQGLEALVESVHNQEEAGVEADRDIDAPSSSSTTEHMKTEPGGEEPGREAYDETETACDSEPLCAVKQGLVAAPMEAGSTMLKSQKHPTEKMESYRITLKETHLNPSHVVCKLCGQAFGYNSSSEHWKHVLLKHPKEGKGVRCMWRECFEAIDSAILPKQLPNNGGGRFCTVCGKCFSSTTALRTHSRIHTGEKPFLCTHCGKRFNQLGNLVGHTRIHTGEKPYPCDVCGKRFRVSNDMQKHMRRMHMRRESIVSIHDNQWPSVAKPAS